MKFMAFSYTLKPDQQNFNLYDHRYTPVYQRKKIRSNKPDTMSHTHQSRSSHQSSKKKNSFDKKFDTPISIATLVVFPTAPKKTAQSKTFSLENHN